MQPAHRRQDRGNSIGALHPEKVLSKAFRTRVRFPPPPPKKKNRAFCAVLLFCVDGVLERVRLHCASNGYSDAARRLRVSIPVYAFCAVLLFCVDGVLERVRLHRASNGYSDAARRLRVLIPVYAFCAVLPFCVDGVLERTYLHCIVTAFCAVGGSRYSIFSKIS